MFHNLFSFTQSSEEGNKIEKGGLGAILQWCVELVLESFLQIVLLVSGRRNSAIRFSPFLKGNFAPVKDEVLVEDIDVRVTEDGVIEAFEGSAFLRIGPNPRELPRGFYHWFDGDGMAHSVRFFKKGKQGLKAVYNNHQIRTLQLKREKLIGHPVFPLIGDLVGVVGLAFVFADMIRKKCGIIHREESGAANTNFIFHNDKLFALHEASMPYQLEFARNGELKTTCRYTWDGKIPAPVTAHPKRDAQTGELLLFGNQSYEENSSPICCISCIGSNGDLKWMQQIGLRFPVMMHDFAITDKYAIIMEHPLVFRPEMMIKKNSLPFVFEEEAGSRYGLLHRETKSLMWFQTASHFVFHTVNAWDDGDEVVLFVCKFDKFELGELSGGAGQRNFPHLCELRFDTSTGEVKETTIAKEISVEFPTVSSQLIGKRSRYAYFAVIDETNKSRSAAKVDLEEKQVVGMVDFGDKSNGGECYFVPSLNPRSEDDGYITTYLYDEGRGVSKVVAYNAKSMSSDPVLEATLPQRVPYGFHTLWLDKTELEALTRSSSTPEGES